jgi:hypothetical protein
VTSRLQFTATEGCPDTFDQIVYKHRILKFVIEHPSKLLYSKIMLMNNEETDA